MQLVLQAVPVRVRRLDFELPLREQTVQLVNPPLQIDSVQVLMLQLVVQFVDAPLHVGQVPLPRVELGQHPLALDRHRLHAALQVDVLLREPGVVGEDPVPRVLGLGRHRLGLARAMHLALTLLAGLLRRLSQLLILLGHGMDVLLQSIDLGGECLELLVFVSA